MVGTILPIVYGERIQLTGMRNGSLAAYVSGSMIGGMTLGTSVSLVGLCLRLHNLLAGSVAVMLLLAFPAHAFLAIREIGVVNVPLPQSHWQVRRTWARELRPQVAALLYGLILGLGVFTRIPTGVFYALVIWMAVLADARFGALAFTLVGFGRALPLMVLARATTNGEQMVRWNAVLHRWFPIVKLTNALILTVAGAWILAKALKG
jgi:hypothetical protein